MDNIIIRRTTIEVRAIFFLDPVTGMLLYLALIQSCWRSVPRWMRGDSATKTARTNVYIVCAVHHCIAHRDLVELLMAKQYV